MQYVAGHPVDFAFCDIRMPGITGLELLDQMHKEKPDLQAAFVTAYDQYAFDAYQLDACDYLLKPFGQEEVMRLILAAEKQKNCLHFLWRDGAALWKWNLPWICYGKKNRSVNR